MKKEKINYKQYGLSGYIKSMEIVINFFFGYVYYQFTSGKLPFLPATSIHFELSKTMLDSKFIDFNLTLYKDTPHFKSLGIHTCKIMRTRNYKT